MPYSVTASVKVLIILQNLVSTSMPLMLDFKFRRIYPCYSDSCQTQRNGTVLRSHFQCLTECSREPRCDIVEYAPQGECVLCGSYCFTFQSCSPADPNVRFYQKIPCQHDGLWNETDDTCQCRNGYVGNRCQRRPRSCRELDDFGYPPDPYDVIMDLHGDGSRYVRIICEVAPDHSALTYILRNTGWTNHNRSYTNYVDGYFYDKGNYWLGLETTYLLNQRGEILVYLGGFYRSGSDFGQWNVVYNNFIMQNATFGYSYTADFLGSVSQGTIGAQYTVQDILGLSQSTPFSALDFDNDGDETRNCAAEAGAGWWFAGCDQGVNPLGWSYQAKPGPTSPGHVAIPGINMTDPEIIDSFDIINMFYRTLP